MIYLRHVILIFLLIGMSPSVLSMDQAPSTQIIVCPSLPQEVWKQIFEWVNYRDDQLRLERVGRNEKLLCTVRSINTLVQYSRLCKDIYRANVSLITSYLQWSADYLKSHDKHALLFSVLTQGDYSQKRLVPLYRKLGADIDHIHADGDTLVTHAIRNENKSLFETLVKLGADLMQPNRRGQVPIDFAYETHSKIAVLLKDNGGDPEDRYKYWGADNVSSMYGGYKNYQPKKKPIVTVSFNSIVPQQPMQVAQQNMYAQVFYRGLATGILICCIGYWIYSQYCDVDDNQKEEVQGTESKPTLVRA